MENVFAGFEPIRRTVTESSSMRLYIAILVVILLGGVAAYYYFKPKADDVTVMGPYVLRGAGPDGPQNTRVTIFDQAQLNKKLGNNFTFSTFVYMDDFNAERIPLAGPKGDFRFKPLLTLLGVGTITLDPIHQMARVELQTLADKAILKRDNVVQIDIENVTVAKWHQLTVCMEGRSVDVYLNGVLMKSALLENLTALYPIGVILETTPDFSGQTCLFQAWPRRLTESQIATNYKRNVDLRGKPLVPEPSTFKWSDVWTQFSGELCKLGFCGFRFNVGPMQYIDYDFA
jgi:hypothetical protein